MKDVREHRVVMEDVEDNGPQGEQCGGQGTAWRTGDRTV